jgi:hypothetical protein
MYLSPYPPGCTAKDIDEACGDDQSHCNCCGWSGDESETVYEPMIIRATHLGPRRVIDRWFCPECHAEV